MTKIVHDERLTVRVKHFTAPLILDASPLAACGPIANCPKFGNTASRGSVTASQCGSSAMERVANIGRDDGIWRLRVGRKA